MASKEKPLPRMREVQKEHAGDQGTLEEDRARPPCPGWVDYETTKDIPQRITWHRWKAKGEDALKDAAAFYRMTDAEVQSRNDEEAGLNRDLLERERIRSGGGTPMHHLPGILKKAHARWYANQKKNPKGGRKNKPPTKEAKRKIKMVRNVPRSPESTRIWRKERRRKKSESDETWRARLLAKNGNNCGWSVAKDERNTGGSKANEAPAEKTSTTRRGMEKLTGASPSEAIRAQQKGSEGGKTPSSGGAQAGQKVEGGDSDLGAGGGPPLGTPAYPEALDGKKKTKPKATGQNEKVRLLEKQKSKLSAIQAKKKKLIKDKTALKTVRDEISECQSQTAVSAAKVKKEPEEVQALMTTPSRVVEQSRIWTEDEKLAHAERMFVVTA